MLIFHSSYKGTFKAEPLDYNVTDLCNLMHLLLTLIMKINSHNIFYISSRDWKNAMAIKHFHDPYKQTLSLFLYFYSFLIDSSVNT